MEQRTLGNTGLELAILGFGGFHLIETASSDAERLLGTYLDRGGNYIETAFGYGDGNSEQKIGAAVSHRREDYYLATKMMPRTAETLVPIFEQSLRNLRTDHVDILFMHAVQTDNELDQILASGGALDAALALKEQGKVSYLAISGHGRQEVMRRAIAEFPFDVIMTGFNYFDRFNFPSVYGNLLPEAREAGIGVLAMKALADGYLYRSWETALRYTLSLPVDCVVAGMNTMQMLTKDLDLAENFVPMLPAEMQEVHRTAPELGDYVCRFCGECATPQFDPQDVFRLEALFDRQMDNRRLDDTANFALRERLRFWFRQDSEARAEYAQLPAQVDPHKDYSELNKACPYGIDIDRKLKISHDKLGADGYLF